MCFVFGPWRLLHGIPGTGTRYQVAGRKKGSRLGYNAAVLQTDPMHTGKLIRTTASYTFSHNSSSLGNTVFYRSSSVRVKYRRHGSE